jgi:CRISPR/Cas system-associated exonuclease Cas4 (RecB family)
MENKEENTRTPINISVADVERAFRKVKEFQKILEKGKIPQQIFEDLVRLITSDG